MSEEKAREQNSIPTSKVERSARFVKTGFKVGGNYIKHYSKKLFNPNLDKTELNEDNAADIYESLSELKGSALKVAQMLSMDKNILPKAYVDKFSQSQYNAPPLSGPLIVKELDVYMREVEERLLEETDYDLEVRRSVEFSNACSNLENIVFPTYYPELSSKRIITMSWIDGQHLREFLQTTPSQELRNQLGQALWDFYNFQQHELRAVHADPHPGNFLITPDGKLGIIDFGCIKEMPEDFYTPFFSLTSTNLLNNKEETIKAFRKLEMILPNDNEQQVEFYYSIYHQMISLFAKPYMSNTFNFGETAFFDELYGFGEQLSRMPEFKQARGVKHFIYVNRTNFGLYNILHELQAQVKTDTYQPHIVLDY